MDTLRQVARSMLRRAARDETELVSTRSALVLAPHPDDETLGCGATILRKVVAGTEVHIAVITDGRNSHPNTALSANELADVRRSEMYEAASRLGVPEKSVRWAGFVDGTLKQQASQVTRYVAGLLAELRPDEVYATCANEPHPDHAVVGAAARAAVAEASWPVRLLEYPIWLWNAWPFVRGARVSSVLDAVGQAMNGTVVKVFSGAHLAGKLHALEAHSSQLRRPSNVSSEPWSGLPPAVLAAARDSSELFWPFEPAR